MKRLLIIALACSVAPLAAAQLYKYVDKDGKTVYSDQPPVNINTKQLNIQSGATSSAAAPAAAPKSAVDRDKDLQKSRDEARDRARKSEDTAKQAQAQEQACTSARQAYQTYADGGRIHKYNAQGERVYLGDQEIEIERERSKREMDEACKKS
jgi:cyclophilin family peptidyl-prolyl cis-trans isomerase